MHRLMKGRLRLLSHHTSLFPGSKELETQRGCDLPGPQSADSGPESVRDPSSLRGQ